MVKVSVIIPVYGVENYIEKCARSLFEQTLKDIEFIFVNDCTVDNSISILENIIEQYPNRKNQVRIIKHSENKGLPIARQTGIKEAVGEYIAHCDSDDWIDKDMYKLMYEEAVNSNADIVICDYYQSTSTSNSIQRGVKNRDKSEITKDLFVSNISWSVWNKLTRRSLYSKDIIYPSCSMGEDMVLTLQMVLLAETISYVNKPLYYYRFNPNSIVNVKGEISILRKLNQQKDNLKLLESFLKHEGFKSNEFLDVIKYRIRNTLNPMLDKKIYKIEWRNLYKDINYKLIFNRYLTFKEKMGFYWRLFFLTL